MTAITHKQFLQLSSMLLASVQENKAWLYTNRDDSFKLGVAVVHRAIAARQGERSVGGQSR